nr:hypothetical protein GCM10020063_010400 [Dactylosporangium thailandense]
MACNNLLKQLHEVEANPRDTGMLGSFGEAIAAVLLHDVLDHEIVVDEATRGKPQGLDLATFDTQSERLMVVEVKTTGSEKSVGPRMGRTISTRQMSDDWVASHEATPGGISRIVEAGLDNVDLADVVEDAVGKLVVHVNTRNDTVTVHEVDADGRVGGVTHSIGLRDLVRFADAMLEKR